MRPSRLQPFMVTAIHPVPGVFIHFNSLFFSQQFSDLLLLCGLSFF
jgi:hypothetical protein